MSRTHLIVLGVIVLAALAAVVTLAIVGVVIPDVITYALTAALGALGGAAIPRTPSEPGAE